MAAKDGVVHVWNLPEDKICVKLPGEIQKDMVQSAIEISKSRKGLARTLDISATNLHDFEKSRFESITLKILSRLSKYLINNNLDEFSLENLERKLEIINKSQHYVAELTDDMVKRDLLKVTKERLPICSGKGFYPKEFEIM